MQSLIRPPSYDDPDWSMSGRWPRAGPCDALYGQRESSSLPQERPNLDLTDDAELDTVKCFK